jgi:hypothetical protein
VVIQYQVQVGKMGVDGINVFAVNADVKDFTLNTKKTDVKIVASYPNGWVN